MIPLEAYIAWLKITCILRNEIISIIFRFRFSKQIYPVLHFNLFPFRTNGRRETSFPILHWHQMYMHVQYVHIPKYLMLWSGHFRGIDIFADFALPEIYIKLYIKCISLALPTLAQIHSMQIILILLSIHKNRKRENVHIANSSNN